MVSASLAPDWILLCDEEKQRQNTLSLFNHGYDIIANYSFRSKIGFTDIKIYAHITIHFCINALGFKPITITHEPCPVNRPDWVLEDLLIVNIINNKFNYFYIDKYYKSEFYNNAFIAVLLKAVH